MQVIWRLVPDREDACDIYQDTFLAYHRLRASERGVTHPKAWLCRTARNRAFGHLAEARRVETAGIDPAAEAAAPVQPAVQSTAYLVGQLRQWVAELPDRQRDAFTMRHFEDLPFAEIAAQLGCTPEAARASVHKATVKLRARLAPLRRHFHV